MIKESRRLTEDDGVINYNTILIAIHLVTDVSNNELFHISLQTRYSNQR